jgi:hypothetical protein
MQKKRKPETKKYPQSEGNLALADEGLGLLRKPKAKTLSPVLRVVQDITEEDSEADALGPATGIIVGIGLSSMLWCLIILVMFWIR